ncbi:tip120 [Anaeramoeba flamelloides]|uniref:Tip120 n=1 Tax=Anaeramoeba flamelloides TaxID=1746091 RepID=A0AAV7Y943_9EUKA|nr:tip120 [Anaeramoeba flamelloides]
MSSSQLVKKLKSIDYDYRFMALSDLVSDLKQRSWNTTRQIDQIIGAVLNLLEDSSREVQELAVECLGLLVLKCSTNHIHSILKTLTTKTLETEEEFLDVFPIAFKRVITQLSHDNLHLILNIADRTLPKFIEGILKSKKPETQNACVEIIHHFLFSFGSAIPNYHREIQNVLLKNFEVTTSRKQVIDTISLLCTNIDDNLFSNLIEFILEKLAKNDKQLSIIYLQLLVVIGFVSLFLRFDSLITAFFYGFTSLFFL